MSDPQCRGFLAAAGIASLAVLGPATPAAGGDPSFMNNVPDPTLAGKDLPTFKFALEKSEGKVIGAPVRQKVAFAPDGAPISRGPLKRRLPAGPCSSPYAGISRFKFAGSTCTPFHWSSQHLLADAPRSRREFTSSRPLRND